MELENIVANTIYLKARESEMTKSGSRSKKWREMLALPHVVDVLHLKNELPLSFNYIYLEQPIGKKLFQQFCQEYQQSSPQVTSENRKISTKTQSSDEVFEKLPPPSVKNSNPPTVAPYAKYIHFLNAKKDYVMAEMEDKLSTGQEILQKYLNPQGANYILDTFNKTLLQSPDKFVHTFPHLTKLFRRASEPLRANSPEPQKNDFISNENNTKNNFNIDEHNPTNFIHRIHKLHDMDAILHETENYALQVLSGEAYDIFLESKYFHRYLQFKGLERRPIDKADFRMFRVLGKGGFGEVNACQHRSTGKLYACKTMIKKRIKKRQAEKLTLDEKRILASIDSRFVVNLTYAFQTKDSLCLILTLMSGGDLKYHLQTMVEIREAQNATSFLNTLSGVFIPKGENNNYQNMGLNGENPSEGKGRKRSSLFSTISQLVSGGDGLDVLNPTTTHNKTSKPNKTKEDTLYAKNDKKVSNINNTPVTVFDKDSSIKVAKKPVFAKSGPGGFEPSRARFYAAEIACGLTHLHSKNIIYRDLKPENILVDDAGHIRISDLGLALQLSGPGFSTKGRVGTVGYMAPEVLLDDHYSFPIDWWSLGCLIYEMIDGKTPFRGYKEKCDKRDINRRVLREETIYFSDRFDQASKDICNKLLEKNHNRRLGSSIRSSHEIANLQNNSGGKSKNTPKIENDIDNISKVPNTTLDITTGKNDDSVQIAMTAGDNKSNTLAENNEIIEKNDNRNNISKTTKKSSITHYSIFDVSSERHILEHAYFTQQLNMAKLKAGKIVPEFVPDPRAVYCKDILDIDQFSSIKGVTLGETDQEFYAKFDTGAVSIPWQNELIETECFRDLNIFSIEHPDSADVTHHDYHTYHKLHHSHHTNLSHGKRNSLLKNRNNTLPSNNQQQHLNNSDENSTTGSQKFRLGHKARSLDANLNELDGHHTSRNPFTFLKHLVFGRRKSSLHSYYVSTNNNNKSMMPQNTNTQQQGNNETTYNPNPQTIDHNNKIGNIGSTPVKLSNVTTNKTMNNANNAHFVTPFWEKLFHFKVC